LIQPLEGVQTGSPDGQGLAPPLAGLFSVLRLGVVAGKVERSIRG
jgi:hypothetical protein